jgi:hypothetical protein
VDALKRRLKSQATTFEQDIDKAINEAGKKRKTTKDL